MEIYRCAACRRELTNPVSIKHGLGPDCLRKAVRAGTAPLDALEELTAWQASSRKNTKARQPRPVPASCSGTLDLFDGARRAAIAAFKAAAAECIALGVAVTYSIEEQS